MPDEWMSTEMAARVVEALSRERSLSDVHVAGGEPTMKMDLLVDVIRMLANADIAISYVETNGGWCTDEGRALDGMKRMRDAGLRGILVSVSVFHNEFIPFRNTRRCVEAAYDVFGTESTYVYLPHMYQILGRMPDDGRHSLEEFIEWADIATQPDAVAGLSGVIPNGRAASALKDSFMPRPASSYAGRTCFRDLTSTSHFHIDHYGNLITGLCPGIAAGTVDDLHVPITEASHPAIHTLMKSGPVGLMAVAERESGFEQRECGYVSKCDLCMDVRTSLRSTGEYEELRPDSFYAE
jgi:hypothetical protein